MAAAGDHYQQHVLALQSRTDPQLPRMLQTDPQAGIEQQLQTAADLLVNAGCVDDAWRPRLPDAAWGVEPRPGSCDVLTEQVPVDWDEAVGFLCGWIGTSEQGRRP